jgi:arylsulfatase A-like enzyme
MPRARHLLALIGASALVAIAALVLLAPLPPWKSLDPDGPPLVILISIDTLRADHLGCYGYGKNTSPHVDRFREDAILFRNAIAQASSTLPSHASILSSLIPWHHGARFSTKTALAEEVVTLTEVLKDRGYVTVSMNGGGQVSAPFGIAQGFDIYKTERKGDVFSRTVERALPSLARHGDGRLFLFLHTYEVHGPYTPSRACLRKLGPAPESDLPRRLNNELRERINRGEVSIEPEDVRAVVHAYDAEIRSMDEGFGKLIRILKGVGIYDRSLIVFTSDHGEEFREHGILAQHSHSLYDELLRVPLLVKLPRSRHAGTTVESLAGGIDVAPTILEALGLPIPASFQGRSLLPDIEGTSPEDLVVVSLRDTPPERRVASIRTDRWKLYDGKLFDLESDPLETRDVSGDHPELVALLADRLRRILEARTAPTGGEARLSDQTLQRLVELGYLHRR